MKRLHSIVMLLLLSVVVTTPSNASTPPAGETAFLQPTAGRHLLRLRQAGEPASTLQATQPVTETSTSVFLPLAGYGRDMRPTCSPESPFSIQIGAFRTETYAQKLAKTVEALGYPTYIHTVGKNGQPPLYQVRFGRFATLDAATQSAGNFRQKENRSAVVVKVPASQKD